MPDEATESAHSASARVSSFFIANLLGAKAKEQKQPESVEEEDKKEARRAHRGFAGSHCSLPAANARSPALGSVCTAILCGKAPRTGIGGRMWRSLGASVRKVSPCRRIAAPAPPPLRSRFPCTPRTRGRSQGGRFSWAGGGWGGGLGMTPGPPWSKSAPCPQLPPWSPRTNF
ncbi:hypothetical protein JRQ81_016008 [Phrynocephalus forsythii]|uniref:Uncharacterized protein n=1 Tax=Phrynocephalus forsythii TaxID=171643 RepID=A0A9Q0XWZ1_9SAUR|nr:hypothetical protein JRQ81_016008 [Phrynocephalus forsythii]